MKGKMPRMFIAVIELKDWLVMFGALFAFVAVGAAIVVYYRFRYAGEDKKADASSIETWKNLALARKAALDESGEEIKKLIEKYHQQGDDLNECMQLREDVTKMNLRLQAKNSILEKSINRLEERAGVQLTNFDEPTTAYSG